GAFVSTSVRQDSVLLAATADEVERPSTDEQQREATEDERHCSGAGLGERGPGDVVALARRVSAVARSAISGSAGTRDAVADGQREGLDDVAISVGRDEAVDGLFAQRHGEDGFAVHGG